jgi:chromosome segregation ATPase
MGVVEEVRSTLQDLLTPELRELKVRIEALENQQKQFRAEVKDQFGQVDKRFEQVDKRLDRIDQRFDSIDNRFEKMEEKSADRHEQVMSEIRRTAIIQELVERVARLEAERRPAQ